MWVFKTIGLLMKSLKCGWKLIIPSHIFLKKSKDVIKWDGNLDASSNTRKKRKGLWRVIDWLVPKDWDIRLNQLLRGFQARYNHEEDESPLGRVCGISQANERRREALLLITLAEYYRKAITSCRLVSSFFGSLGGNLIWILEEFDQQWGHPLDAMLHVFFNKG